MENKMGKMDKIKKKRREASSGGGRQYQTPSKNKQRKELNLKKLETWL